MDLLTVTTLPAPTLLNATVLDVHDGDTFEVEIAWGRRRFDRPVPIRLLGCNAHELGTPGGDAAMVNLRQMLPAGTPVLLVNPTDDKYAPRLDAEVIYHAMGSLRNLAVDLVAQFWAAPWNGKGPRPLPPWPRPGHRLSLVDAHNDVRRAATQWRRDPR